MVWVLIWYSRFGKEELDQADTYANALYLRQEYLLAFGEGTIKIKARKVNTNE